MNSRAEGVSKQAAREKKIGVAEREGKRGKNAGGRGRGRGGGRMHAEDGWSDARGGEKRMERVHNSSLKSAGGSVVGQGGGLKDQKKDREIGRSLFSRRKGRMSFVGNGRRRGDSL